MRLPMRSWYETWTRFWPLARRRRRACKVAGTLRRAVAAPLDDSNSVYGAVRRTIQTLARDGFRAVPQLFGGPAHSAAHRDRKRRSALQQLEARELLTGTMQIHDGPNVLANAQPNRWAR